MKVNIIVASSRRLIAFVCDTVLFGVLFLGLTAWSFHRVSADLT